MPAICDYDDKSRFFSRLSDHINEIFRVPPDWDVENKYRVDNINVYFENHKSQKVFPVDVEKSLKEIMQNEK